jgi:endonuclease/exonuclease/phosphatase (EEP) superfamily protein YafD
VADSIEDIIKSVAKPPVEKVPAKSIKLKKRKRGFTGCLLGLTFGVLGLVGARMGNLWVAFDVFAQFFLQFVMIALAFAIGLFLPRAKTFLAILLVILFAVAYGAWPHVLNRGEQIPDPLVAGEKLLKVASFNTYYDNLDFTAQSAEILRLNADVVTLIELGANKMPVLDSLKASYPYQFYCFEDAYCHFAIISKFPMSGFEKQTTWEGAPYVRASLGPAFGNLVVYGVHTTRFPHSRAQLAQVTALATRLEQETFPLLVMGDFNATPFSRVTRVFPDRLNLVRHTSLPTWPAKLGLPQLAIDQIFTSPQIRPLTAERIGNAAGSDHFPITMTFAVPEK